MADPAKKLSFPAVIATVICVVFVAEAAAPAAAIGNAQFFWWIFLIVTFLLPYGMVVAELGTTYEGEGGIYDWIRDGLGDTWGARAAWWYWINYPLWMASLATMFPAILGMVFGVRFNLVTTMVIELAFVWVVVALSFSRASDSVWVLNGGAILKVLVAVGVGALGIWYALEHGFASDLAPQTFLPDLGNITALNYLSVIIFNFMGFEVITTFADQMRDPEHDIPKAIILGGLGIAAIYLFAGFGIGAAIPSDRIAPDYGMIYALRTMVGASPIFKIICIAFLITLFANMASWSFGVNSVASYAARQHNMPRAFARLSKRTGMPDGAAIINGIVATLVLCIQLIPVEAISNGIFWMLFDMNVVFLLITYIPMFPAFLRLRRNDPDRRRTFRFPFRGRLMIIMLAVPAVELVLTVIASIVPLSGDEIGAKLPILIGFLALLAVGEIVRMISSHGRTTLYRGLTPELAAERLRREAGAAGSTETDARDRSDPKADGGRRDAR